MHVCFACLASSHIPAGHRQSHNGSFPFHVQAFQLLGIHHLTLTNQHEIEDSSAMIEVLCIEQLFAVLFSDWQRKYLSSLLFDRAAWKERQEMKRTQRLETKTNQKTGIEISEMTATNKTNKTMRKKKENEKANLTHRKPKILDQQFQTKLMKRKKKTF